MNEDRHRDHTLIKKVTDYKCPECGSEEYECIYLFDVGEYDPVTGGRNGSSTLYKCCECGEEYLAVHEDGCLVEG